MLGTLFRKPKTPSLPPIQQPAKAAAGEPQRQAREQRQRAAGATGYNSTLITQTRGKTRLGD